MPKHDDEQARRLARAKDLGQQLLDLVARTRDQTIDKDTGAYSLPGHTLAFYVFDGQPEIVYVVIKGALEPDMRCYPIAVPAILHSLGGLMLNLERVVAAGMGMTPNPIGVGKPGPRKVGD